MTEFGEGQATGEFVKLSPEAEAARKKRILMTALALFAFVAIVFTITMVRLGDSAADFSREHDLSRALGADTSIADPDAGSEGEAPE